MVLPARTKALQGRSASAARWYTERAIRALLSWHLARYPMMTPQDAYKLLYQGALGPQHSIPSAVGFKDRLRAEMESLGAEAGALVWEPVRADNTLGRVHLRAFIARHGNPGLLATACLRTAKAGWGNQQDLVSAWSRFSALCRRRIWSAFPASEVCALTEELADSGYPALHHSARYKQAYSPAYRVLSAAEARPLLGAAQPRVQGL